MADEKPVNINVRKRKHADSQEVRKKYCIIHFGHNTKDLNLLSFTDHSFNRVLSCRKIRLAATNPTHRFDDVCNGIPDELDSAIHYYHRWCYKKFTNLQRVEYVDATTASTSKHSPRKGAGSVLFPKNSCVFCNKERKWVPSRSEREYPTQCVTETAAKSILTAAENKKDEKLLRQIRGVDLLPKRSIIIMNAEKNTPKIRIGGILRIPRKSQSNGLKPTLPHFSMFPSILMRA
ncbi:unnamed protein product [Bemisia tabaci]|uniref:Uncharacterized protein n=1 Tax=Bemisia tabaci TaxID=7038 RepID=A0A9P0F0S3_BEMTA|nr:unnamed protein product [Bemisia tabaci]